VKYFNILHYHTDGCTYSVTSDYLVKALDEETLYVHIHDKVSEFMKNEDWGLSSEIEILGNKFSISDFVYFDSNNKIEFQIIINELDLNKIPTLQ
jgi:hypothetical protein